MVLELDKITARIDLIRREKGLTQEQFAAELGISQPAVSYYLKERIPPADIILKIAGLGQTTVEWILTGQKSYLMGTPKGEIHEPQECYDADMILAKRIAALPAEVRKSIQVILDFLENQSR
jgi:transcriptional regulator with XRE-family HTH domain